MWGSSNAPLKGVCVCVFAQCVCVQCVCAVGHGERKKRVWRGEKRGSRGLGGRATDNREELGQESRVTCKR